MCNNIHACKPKSKKIMVSKVFLEKVEQGILKLIPFEATVLFSYYMWRGVAKGFCDPQSLNRWQCRDIYWCLSEACHSNQSEKADSSLLISRYKCLKA